MAEKQNQKKINCFADYQFAASKWEHSRSSPLVHDSQYQLKHKPRWCLCSTFRTTEIKKVSLTSCNTCPSVSRLWMRFLLKTKPHLFLHKALQGSCKHQSFIPLQKEKIVRLGFLPHPYGTLMQFHGLLMQSYRISESDSDLLLFSSGELPAKSLP